MTITGLGATSPLTLTGGHVRNGNGGAILVDNPRNVLTLAYVNVVGNSAAQVNHPRLGAKGNGGGIYSSGTVTLDHTSVSCNSANGPNGASGHAGGVYTDQGVTLIASHVDSNTARNAAGILNVFGSVEVLERQHGQQQLLLWELVQHGRLRRRRDRRDGRQCDRLRQPGEQQHGGRDV